MLEMPCELQINFVILIEDIEGDVGCDVVLGNEIGRRLFALFKVKRKGL